MATVSPGATANEISCRMTSGSPPLSTCLPNPSTLTTSVSAAVSSMRSTLRLLVLFAFVLLAPAAHAARTILVYGDSLSAGFGIRQDAAWPALLQKRLAERRLDYSVVNASISGETTSGGRSRIAEALARHKPAVVVVALGANDGLRGLPLAGMRDNLAGIVAAAKRAKAQVLLVGMRLPPNYGAYADEFAQSFRTLAQREKTPLVPFLLDGIADQPALFQPDALHPTAAAQPRLLDNVWEGLAPLLK
ncbi:arylesterase [Azospira restricta]|uniref:Arylesterase n=2 Tax=Azospira restricta TaxID=404405 RepID=A0A974SMZ1_9RHOO|nr:arylesterase [Azospira restricta]